MTDRKINPRILKNIRRNSRGDDAIADFLVDLVYEEAENSSGWHWRRIYKEKVKQYSERWRNEGED